MIKNSIKRLLAISALGVISLMSLSTVAMGVTNTDVTDSDLINEPNPSLSINEVLFKNETSLFTDAQWNSIIHASGNDNPDSAKRGKIAVHVVDNLSDVNLIRTATNTVQNTLDIKYGISDVVVIYIVLDNKNMSVENFGETSKYFNYRDESYISKSISKSMGEENFHTALLTGVKETRSYLNGVTADVRQYDDGSAIESIVKAISEWANIPQWIIGSYLVLLVFMLLAFGIRSKPALDRHNPF